MEKVFAGTELYNCADIDKELNFAIKNKFDFMAIPLVHPRNRRDDVGVSSRRLDLSRDRTRCWEVISGRHLLWVRFRIGFVLIRRTKM